VEKILAWCAPGAINEAMEPGHLVAPDDILDETRGEPYTFFPKQGLGFIRQNPVFCPELRRALIRTLKRAPFPWHPQGVYVATSGPRLETPAEIRKFRTLGGDLVGMTLVPEVFLARELELCYAALCYVVNFAEGLKDRPFQPGVLFEGLATPEEVARVQQVEGAFADLVLGLLPEMAAAPGCAPASSSWSATACGATSARIGAHGSSNPAPGPLGGAGDRAGPGKRHGGGGWEQNCGSGPRPR
jgi:5'-methylthioadenosine phosphorylase